MLKLRIPARLFPPLVIIAAAVLQFGSAASAGEDQTPRQADVGSAQRAAQPSDSILALAREAMSQGRPWRATELLSALMRDSTKRTAEVLILSARAAAAWGGWREVKENLEDEPWLDSLYGGDGRALLARARLGTDDDTLAAEDARMSLGTAPSDSERGMRLVVLAQASAEIQDAATAAASYREAATLLPVARDWLLLRAAEFLADSIARHEVLGSLTLAGAVTRAKTVDAVASENTGDTLGAIARYAVAGNFAASYRLRRAIMRSELDSATLRSEIMAALGRGPGAALAREYVDVFDSSFTTRSAEEDLSIARALGSAGGGRTARSWSRAFAGGAGNDNDRFQYATLLARLGQNGDAIREFARVKTPASLAAAAAYQRARTMLRANEGADWREALRGVVRDFPTDTSAATALYLLADLATDEGRDSAARDAFLSSARRFPGNSRASAALFHAAMIAYVHGDFSDAAADFRSLRESYPRSAEATSSRYWEARSLEKAGDTSAVRTHCGVIRASDSLSYYATRCARRLGITFWSVVPAPDSFVSVPAIDSVSERVRLLRDLQFDPEIVSELELIRTLSAGDAERALSAGNTLRALGYGSRAVQMAQTAQARGARPDARLYRMLYPSNYLDLVAIEAAQYGVDLYLLAGLIRQESLFNPGATSPAGARGLMQVMPTLGGDVARSFGFPVWDPVLLWQPDVNVRLGVKHFAELLASQDHLFHVLASYNAGASRVTRWLTKRGSDDPEVFVDRIPFVETRDYVRIVARNADMYRVLNVR